MNRTLKRPMFRMGGSTGTGITSGLDKPRTNYQFGGGAGMAADNIRLSDLPFMKNQNETPSITIDKPQETTSMLPSEQLMKAFADRDTKPDLSQFLINFGLNLASATPRGNIIATAAEAAKAPTDTLFKQIGAEKAFDRQLALSGAEMDINQRLKKEAADQKFSNDLALALAKVKPEAKTAAVKNALAMGLKAGTKAFNDYVTAATIKGSGLNIEFDDQGNLKSITQGNVPDNKKFVEQAMELKNATFAMNNVANTLINNLQGAKVSTVGGFINALDSVGSQLKQLADATGFRTGGYKDEGTGAIDNYLRKNLGEGIFADAVKYGKIRSNAINLAYLMARVDEPGGRFTDRDIALKMEEIGIGANPEKTAQILASAVDLRNKNAAFAYKQLTGNELNFEGFTLIDSSKDTKKTDESDIPEYIFEGGKVFQIIDGKKVEVKI